MLRLRLAHSRLPADLRRDPVACSEQACFAGGRHTILLAAPKAKKRVLAAAEGRAVLFAAFVVSHKRLLEKDLCLSRRCEGRQG